MPDDYASKADVDGLRRRMDAVESSLKDNTENLRANTEATNRIEQNTADLVEMFRNMQGAFGVLRGIGKLARPLAYIAMLVGAVASAIAALKGLVK